MKLKHLLPFLAMAAGIFAGCTGEEAKYENTQDKLDVSPASQKIAKDGTASFTFTLTLTSPSGKVHNLKETNTTATISFEATGGSVSPASATTDENGQVTVTFTATDPKTFAGGSVKGVVKNVKGVVDQQGNLATAIAEVLPRDASDDKPIDMALELKDNTYSIQKKDGQAQVFTFPQEYSTWYVGSSYSDGTKQAVHVEMMDEDEKQMTQGWFYGEIPPEVANKLTNISQELYDKYPWMAAKLGSTRLGQDKMIDCHMGMGGNVKLDGSSQIWLKEKSGTKAYSGQYQLLFTFVFENQIWDQATETYLPGDEYILCGNATIEELKADLSSFSLNYECNWVAPGKSITLTAFWTPGASFDWSKVTLKSQTRNNYSGEWFSWDASTQKLTAVNSAENQQVELTFAYAGTDMTNKITLYNGPGYSSFSLSPKEGSADFMLVENDPAYGWSSDSIYIEADEWAPKDTYSFNGYGIEIDPATENYNKLYYNPYGKYVDFKKGIPVGDFDLIFRSVTDHSAKYTIPVKVVEHKVISFQITYKHKNGVFEPFTSGGENGVCNYPMGMEVGVITNPEDAYWDWSHVELQPGYDTYFSFSGYGGRDDHPKLFLKSSTGSTQYGTQVIFRLKWDNRKKSEIYVDHN